VDQRGLVERARQGEHDAFASLVDVHLARLDAAARLILRDPEFARDVFAVSVSTGRVRTIVEPREGYDLAGANWYLTVRGWRIGLGAVRDGSETSITAHAHVVAADGTNDTPDGAAGRDVERRIGVVERWIAALPLPWLLAGIRRRQARDRPR
jgi:hypothetical protein